jgi:cell division transport system permease protein
MTARHWFAAAAPGMLLRRNDAMHLLPWVFALLAYIAGLSGTGLVLAAAGQRSTAQGFMAAMSVELPADVSAARLETTLAALRQTPGIVSARPLDAAETARLLEPWLGPAAPLNELPVPKLVEVRVEAGRSIDLATLRKQLTSIVSAAQVDDHSRSLDVVRSATQRIEIVLVVVMAAALLALVPAAVFATRNALAADRQSIELAQLLGAADRDLARPLAMRALRLGLAGGGGGGIAVIATVAALHGTGVVLRLPALGGASGIADWRVWANVAADVLAAGVIAAVSAYATVLRRLAAMP